jgi:hypothetical protein
MISSTILNIGFPTHKRYVFESQKIDGRDKRGGRDDESKDKEEFIVNLIEIFVR